MAEMTVSEARKLVDDHFTSKEGIECPCCDTHVIERPRKFSSGMAATLIWIVRAYEKKKDWIHVRDEAPRFVIKSNEYGRLVLWGLLEAKPNMDTKKKSSGFYRPTPKGIRVAYNREVVQKMVHARKGIVRKFSGPFITIMEALRSPFDYAELMGWK